MHCISGTVYINKQGHRLAFCGQNPWLEHATIRDNILYGCEYDPFRYSKVLEVCALEHDLFTSLPAGDLTGTTVLSNIGIEADIQLEIGEKGVTLSGGQRSRISLARAVYSRAEVRRLCKSDRNIDLETVCPSR